MPYVTTRRPRIYYERRGRRDAPPLVMLRGLGRRLAHWGRLADDLESLFHLVLIDNRGAGRSDAVRRPYSVSDMASDTVAVLDHVGVERAHFFGISLGGMIAQRIAIDHPQRVDHLVLGCTSPGGEPSPWVSGRAKLALLRARIRNPAEAVAAEAQMVLSHGFRQAHPEVVADWVKLATDFPVKRSTLMLQLWAATRHNPGRQLHRITAPTLIICSDADTLVPPDNSRLLARRIKGAEIEWLHGAGHDFATECPERTAAIVSGFLLDES